MIRILKKDRAKSKEFTSKHSFHEKTIQDIYIRMFNIGLTSAVPILKLQ